MPSTAEPRTAARAQVDLAPLIADEWANHRAAPTGAAGPTYGNLLASWRIMPAFVREQLYPAGVDCAAVTALLEAADPDQPLPEN